MADEAVIITDESSVEVVPNEAPNVDPSPVTPTVDDKGGDSQLLAGKYKTQDDLLQGYLELEKKLGTQSTQDKEQTVDPLTLQPKVGDVDVTDTPQVSASSLIDSFEADFASTGELTDEQLAQLKDIGVSQEDAELILNTRKDKAEKYLTDLLEPVGGTEGWTQITEVLLKNMTDEKMAEFNEAMTQGNTLVKSLLINHAKETVDAVEGVKPTAQTTGDSTKVSKATDSFTTQSEMAKAVGDPRYINDPTYRAEVDAKIMRSDRATMNGYNS